MSKGHAATAGGTPRRIKASRSVLHRFGALAGTALAKEGAVTKLDALPPGGLHAGQTIPVGFTILMDGVEPYKADVAEIVVRNGTGKVLSYPATAQGAAGHYVANVYFPAAGTYTAVPRAFLAPMTGNSRSPSSVATSQHDASATLLSPPSSSMHSVPGSRPGRNRRLAKLLRTRAAVPSRPAKRKGAVNTRSLL